MLEDDKKPKNSLDEESSSDDSSSSQGGQSGQIDFRDFTASAQYLRDDLLPQDTKKRLLSVHKDTHEMLVKKQKDVRDQRQLAKSQTKKSSNQYGQGVGHEISSPYKPNPMLVDKVQFSGIDKPVSPIATENVSEANEALRQKADHEYQLRYRPQNAPRFIPPKLQR